MRRPKALIKLSASDWFVRLIGRNFKMRLFYLLDWARLLVCIVFRQTRPSTTTRTYVLCTTCYKNFCFLVDLVECNGQWIWSWVYIVGKGERFLSIIASKWYAYGKPFPFLSQNVYQLFKCAAENLYYLRTSRMKQPLRTLYICLSCLDKKSTRILIFSLHSWTFLGTE